MFYIYADGQQIYKPLDEELVILNPKLTIELGKAGCLEFDISPANPYYNRLEQLSTEVNVDMDDDEIFHGRVLSNERMFNNVRHVYCEGDLSYLVDSVQKGIKYSGTTHALFRQIIANHNARMPASKQFTVGTINIANRDIKLVGQSEDENPNTGEIDYEQIAINSIVDEWNNTFDYIQTCLIDYCGGYLRTRRENGTLYIDLLDNFQNRAIQPIELGSNLLDLTEEISAEDVFTVLIPLGDDNLTIASVNDGSDEIVDANAVARFGRIIKTHVFNNVSSASTLLENARRFMATNVNVPRTINVKVVDLHLLNPLISPIRIGDRVVINSPAHDVDDELTCTRIEYDLEKPENNSYTFGNPKQTLTQRYREDARLSNDTYGNSAAMAQTGTTSASAASPAKASAAAAGAAGKAADKEKEKSLQKFYDAWINCDPELGQISLGALHRDYINGKEVLLSECGIDMDGGTGNINIKSLHNVVDDHGHLIAENTAHINVVETDTSVAIEQNTQRIEHLAGEEANHYTEITQRADTLGSNINILARDFHDFENDTTNAIANINMVANDHESRISQNATYISNVNGVVTQHTASITALANEQESIISIKADKVEVQAAVTSIENLMTGRTTASAIRATDIKAGSISLFAEGNAGTVATYAHSHTIAATEQSGGKVQINIGAASSTVPQTTSFDIANTQFYKDGVAAVTIESLGRNTSENITYSSDKKTMYVPIVAKNKAGTALKSAKITVSATTPYNAGVSSVTMSSVSASAGTPTYQSGVKRYVVPVTITGKASNDATTSDTVNIYVSGATAYNAGADSVTISSIGASAGSSTYQSGMTRYVVPVTLSARASNGAYGTDSVNIYVSASEAYNAGYYDGQASSSGYTNVYYDITDQQTSSKIKITVVVYGYNGSYYEAIASGVHEYAK